MRHWTMQGGEMWEHRAEVQASVECTVCGNDVELEADTDCWVEGWKGRWEHDGFGPAMGECCGLLYADWWEGNFRLSVPPSTKGGSRERRFSRPYPFPSPLG